MATKCECCGEPGKYTILVSDTDGRLYLPNQIVREYEDQTRELLLCHKCMRTVEDNFRATIAYLKSENSNE